MLNQGMSMPETVTRCRAKHESAELSFPVPWGIIAAKAYGDPCLPPVLMVHGLQDNAGTFDRLMTLLPPTFFYVNIDLPGHGKSTRFPKGIYLDFMLYISAIKRVIKHLRWTEFFYIGHSLGGQMGSYYAALYPDEIKKLVMLDTISQLTVSQNGFLNHYRECNKQLYGTEEKLLNKTPPNYTYEEALDRIITQRPFFISREAAEALIKRSLKEGKNNTYYFSTDQRLKFGVRTAMTPETHIKIISKIQCPVLIVITNTHLALVDGKNSFEKISLDFFKEKKNFQIVTVDGDHDVHNNEPEVVAPHVKKFLFQQKSLL